MSVNSIVSGGQQCFWWWLQQAPAIGQQSYMTISIVDHRSTSIDGNIYVGHLKINSLNETHILTAKTNRHQDEESCLAQQIKIDQEDLTSGQRHALKELIRLLTA